MASGPRIPSDRVETVALATLKANPRNARTHSKRQIKLIADSLKAFARLLRPVRERPRPSARQCAVASRRARPRSPRCREAGLRRSRRTRLA